MSTHCKRFIYPRQGRIFFLIEKLLSETSSCVFIFFFLLQGTLSFCKLAVWNGSGGCWQGRLGLFSAALCPCQKRSIGIKNINGSLGENNNEWFWYRHADMLAANSTQNQTSWQSSVVINSVRDLVGHLRTWKSLKRTRGFMSCHSSYRTHRNQGRFIWDC